MNDEDITLEGEDIDINDGTYMAIDWDSAARWANYIAQCSDGIAVQYERDPIFIDFGDTWHYVNAGGRHSFAGESPVVPKENTKATRPSKLN